MSPMANGDISAVACQDEKATANNGETNGVTSTFVKKKTQKNRSEGIKEKALADSAVIKVENFQIPPEGKDLFVNASLLIADGKRYGLVGSNRSGKAALLKYIEDQANFHHMDVMVWNQTIVDNEQIVYKAVTESFKYTRLWGSYKKLKSELEKPDAKQKKGYNEKEIKLKELYKELMMIDPEGVEADTKASKILRGLGIFLQKNLQMQNIPEYLRRRVSLAKALFLQPDLLILNDPTNHLDLEAFLWLENYLQDWKKSLIVMSEDRCFLDNVCNEIIHLNQLGLFFYKGNYSLFEEKKRKKFNKKVKKEEEKSELQANGKSGRIPVKLLRKPTFSFADPVNFSQRNLLEIPKGTYGYKMEKTIFETEYDISVFYDDRRLAVVGPLQSGKSTILKVLNGELISGTGEAVKIDDKVKIGVFKENSLDELPEEQSALKYLKETCKKHKNEIAEQLNKLGLPTHTHKLQMKDLSATEKTGVILAKFCLVAHHVLLLDNPTRHMDIDMINKFVDAIRRFKGAVCIVTDNEYVIRESECGFIYIKNQALKFDIEDFDQYKRRILKITNSPWRGKVYERKTTPLPLKLISDSKIIDNYIFEKKADPRIKEIGKYLVIYEECFSNWGCTSPTLLCATCATTKEVCYKRILTLIEQKIETLIQDGEEVPPPP